MNHHGHNGPPSAGGGGHGHHHRPHHEVAVNHGQPPAKWHSFKMLVDPMIHRGAPKMVRYDGINVPGNPHHVPPLPQDPRSRLPNNLWKRMEDMDLPVPRFKIDENYVGEPPKVEVTVENMNDNVDKQFLARMVEKCGVVEDIKIYYHPVSGKHLGLAHLCFEEVKSAKQCVSYLHGKSVMGQQLNCYIDPLAKSCLKMYAEKTEEKKPEPPPQVIPEAQNDLHEDFTPERGDNHDWHSFPPPRRRESREDPRRPSHEYDRRPSYTREGSLSQDESAPPPPPPPSTVTSNVMDQHYDYNNHHDDSTYQPTHYDPNYWQQEAQKYAAMQQQPVQPPAASNNNENEDVNNVEKEEIKDEKDEENDENEDNEDDHQIDLDTRLKMLMKGKAGSAMPSFLLNELNDGSDEEEEEVKDALNKVDKVENNHHVQQAPSLVFVPEAPLSRAPSPFLSEANYKHCHEAWQAQKKKEFDKKVNGNKAAKSDDGMSLSSLSSGENNILQQGPLPNYYGYYPPPPGFDHHHPQQEAWYTHQYMQQYPEQYHYGDVHGSHGHGMHANGVDQGQHYPYADQSQCWQDPYTAIKESLKSGKKSEKNIFRPIIKEAVRVVVQDLTQTLTKDINKRMCETLGFYLFEKWWQEQETKYKEKHSNVPSTSTTASKSGPSAKKSTSETTATTTTTTVTNKENDNLPRIPRVQDISSFFDKQRESMETTGMRSGFGLGFRGTIPKLPAFKKKPGASVSSKSKSSSSKKKGSSSDESEDKKKRSEKRKDHEKRREERQKLEKDSKSSENEKKKGSTTISSIYKSLYSDTDESKDTELSDMETKKATSPKKEESSKEVSPKKKLTKKPVKKKDKREWSPSASSVEDPSSTSTEEEEEEEELVKPAPKAKKDVKKAVKSSKMDVDESSQGSESKKGGSSTSESSSSSSSASESSSKATSSTSTETSEAEEEEDKKKPAPIRRASETLKTDSGNKIKASPESESTSTPSHIFEDHCYARPKADVKPEVEPKNENFENQFFNDHGYTRPRTPPAAAKPVKKSAKPSIKPAAIFNKKNKAAALEQAPVLAPKRTFKERSSREEIDIMYKFLTKGLDLEDIQYLKRAYNMLLERQDMSKMLNYTHWVDHTVTEIQDPPPPPKKKRKVEADFSKPHLTGSARTEGYYKMDPREKARTKYHLQRGNAGEASGIVNMEGAVTKAKIQSAQSMSREMRNTQRRQLAVLGDEIQSDLLKFNQLKFRRKNMTFGKSSIHDWGLFAREYIGADEMVIEYVGQVVRPVISDVREKRYEKQGIGSSYLFRIDMDYVVDATKCGNLARFINHSCDPNCYAKIITIDGQKKIVIYSKQPIAYGEEITYDYKFPIEDEKILCLCGAKNCRKYLN